MKFIHFALLIAATFSTQAFASSTLTCTTSNSLVPSGYQFVLTISGSGDSAAVNVSASNMTGDFTYNAEMSANVGKLGINLPADTVVISGTATVTYPDAPPSQTEGVFFVQSQILNGDAGILTVLTGEESTPVQYACK